MTAVARAIHVAPSIKAYLVDLADATRNHANLALGMSPRSVLALQRAGRARAAALGRDYVTPDDIKVLAGPLLEHRIVLTPEAALGGLGPAEVLEEVLGSVAVPTGRG
jgi:MoxR-like ATPase